MSGHLVFTIQNKKDFDEKFSMENIKGELTKSVKKSVPRMKKIMYDVTPKGDKVRKDRLPGNLKKGWMKSQDGKPTSRVTATKNNHVNVFLYNRAKDKSGKYYAQSVNDGHISKNQFGGPYKTYGGDKSWVMGKFFMERGVNRIENDTTVKNIVETDISERLNRL